MLSFQVPLPSKEKIPLYQQVSHSVILQHHLKLWHPVYPDEAIKYATAVSAIVVTRQGAQDSIPTREEIEKFIEENK